MALLVKANKPRRVFQPNINSSFVAYSKPAALGQTAAQTLWTVSGGPVLVEYLFGRVTTVIQTQTNNCQLNHVADASETLALASDFDITAATVGTLLYVEGDGTALVDATEGGIKLATASGANYPIFILPEGTLNATFSASNTGVIEWFMGYRPIHPSAKVVKTSTAQAADALA